MVGFLNRSTVNTLCTDIPDNDNSHYNGYINGMNPYLKMKLIIRDLKISQLMLRRNIYCRYVLESLCQSDSNKYSQYMICD